MTDWDEQISCKMSKLMEFWFLVYFIVFMVTFSHFEFICMVNTNVLDVRKAPISKIVISIIIVITITIVKIFRY